MAGERPGVVAGGASQGEQVFEGVGRDPDGRIRLGEAKIYTLREFNHNAAGVVDEIHASGQPAAITKYGRLVALITGLPAAKVDLALTRGTLAKELQTRAETERPRAYSPDDVQQRINEHYRARARSVEGSDFELGDEVTGDATQHPKSRILFDEFPIYTMREVSQNPGPVFDKINASGKQAVLTKHGRVLAVITGLADAQIESMVLRRGAVAQQAQTRAGSARLNTYSYDEVQGQIEVHYEANYEDAEVHHEG